MPESEGNSDGNSGLEIAFDEVSPFNEGFLISPGQTACFQGVPTVNPWGLILEVLLMAGLEVVAVRCGGREETRG